MPSPPHSSPTTEAHPWSPGEETGEFSLDERVFLLRLAHEAIESALEDRTLQLEQPSPHLAVPRGVFTTLYSQGELRGCVGYVYPISPLYRAVAETARAAASQDTRFRPVSCNEAAQLRISLSILSPLKPIEASQVKIGRHGLMVSSGARRGLLLPQVPVEHQWDRIAFLEQTCRKAGLPVDAWRTGATLEGFTAEVFGDPDIPA